MTVALLDLHRGVECAVILPRRVRTTRLRYLRTEPDGTLTFVLPKNGGLRTVHPDAVKTIYRPRPQRQ